MIAERAPHAMGNRASDSVLVNARFESRRPTGVDVHAAEVLSRLTDIERISPPRRMSDGIAGHLWEQTALPVRVSGGLLWSPCNTGPVMARRHVLTLHDVAPFDVAEHYSSAYRAMACTTMGAAARRATAIATVSQFSADRIADRLGVPDDRIHVVGNGVRAEFRETPTAASTERPDERYVVTLGSLDPRKRVARLVDVHARALPDAVLRIIGGANQRVFASHGVEGGSHAEMLGFLPTADVVRWMRGAAAFVSYSGYEGFGLPPLEAAALEVPVIVSDIPAHREVFAGLQGVYFAADDDELGSLLRGAVVGELAATVRSEVVDRHDWNRVADRYAEVFGALTDDGPSPSVVPMHATARRRRSVA